MKRTKHFPLTITLLTTLCFIFAMTISPARYSAGKTIATQSSVSTATLIGQSINLGCVFPPFATTVFYTNTTTFEYRGGTVTLASNPDGTGIISTDDELRIDVTRPDSTTVVFSYVFGYPRNPFFVETLPPQDVSNLFQLGLNTVNVTYIDNSQCASSTAYYLHTLGSSVCSPPAAGLVIWWPGEGSASDIIGRNNGILHGNTTFVAGEVAEGFHFNGIDQFVEVPDAPSQKPSAITVDAWVKLDSLDSPGGSQIQGLQYIVFKKNSRDFAFEGYSLVKFRNANGQNLFAFVVSSAQGTQIQAISTTQVVVGQFYHVAGTYDRTAFKLYVNGVLAGC